MSTAYLLLILALSCVSMVANGSGVKPARDRIPLHLYSKAEGSCVYADEANEIFFDLTELGEVDYIVPQIGATYNFKLNPCNALSNVPPNEICTPGAMVCQTEQSDGSPVYLVANMIQSLTYVNRTDSLELLLWGGQFCPVIGEYREALITFTCSNEDTLGNPIYVSEIMCSYRYSWMSSAGCKKSSPPNSPSGGLSAGSVLCIIFFCSVFVYFVAGSVYKYVKEEARGPEMVPNIDFWRGLPSLVTDGFLYTQKKTMAIINKEGSSSAGADNGGVN